MVSDPNWANVKLLLHCDSLVEEVSGINLSVAGSAAVSTAQQVFGSGSISIPGSSSYAYIADSADWDFGTGDFTIELRVRFTSSPTSNSATLITHWPGGWHFGFTGSGPYFRAISSTDSTAYAWTPTLNQWYAMAVDRSSGTLRIYINGAMVSKTTSYTIDITGGSTPLAIGSLNPASFYGYDLSGFVDEVRITKGTARYGSDAGYTVATARFPTLFSGDVTDAVLSGSVVGSAGRYGVVNTSGVMVVNTPLITARGATLTSGVGVASVLAPSIVAILRERLGIAATAQLAAKYGLALTDLLRVTSALLAGRPVALTQGIGVHDVSRAAIGAYVLERLGLTNVLLPAAKYGQTATERLRITDALRRFIGGAFADTLGMHDTLTPAYRALRTLTDAVGVHDAVAPKLLLRITAADTVKISAAQALKMVFKPVLTDAVEITAAHVSPNGTITTWVVNTRTGAVTEYGNYDFNSFAQHGHKYLGASSTGLYELNGDDDQGADIIAKIKSGWAQFAGSRYSMFHAAYLGMHASGDVFFKIEAGTGETYTYRVVVQDMQTTKVRMGKGLRARYFAFELTTTGQDFDLDTIEFVPIVAQRRV